MLKYTLLFIMNIFTEKFSNYYKVIINMCVLNNTIVF